MSKERLYLFDTTLRPFARRHPFAEHEQSARMPSRRRQVKAYG
jgi:hypothetical protein